MVQTHIHLPVIYIYLWTALLLLIPGVVSGAILWWQCQFYIVECANHVFKRMGKGIIPMHKSLKFLIHYACTALPIIMPGSGTSIIHIVYIDVLEFIIHVINHLLSLCFCQQPHDHWRIINPSDLRNLCVKTQNLI